MDQTAPLLRRVLGVQACLGVALGCATLGGLGLVRPPSFEDAPERRSEVRLFGPGRDRPLGGAGIRIWARALNPNTFALTLSTVRGTLYLEDVEAAEVDLPLGLPLAAGGETVFPIDVTVGFDRLPDLAGVLGRALAGSETDYRLRGTVGVDAGPFGTPTFGPFTVLSGEARVVR